MDLLDMFGLPDDLIEVDARFSFRLQMHLPLVGKREIVELRLAGFSDDDGDLMPEFDIDLEVFDMDVIPERFEKIELDPKLVAGAITGGKDATQALFAAVKAGVEKRGRKVPY